MNASTDKAEDVGETAADWFVRLQSDIANDDDWAAFAAWLRQDPSHQQAFRAVEDLWVDLDLATEDAGLPTERAKVAPFNRKRRVVPWVAWCAGGGIAAALIVGVVAIPTLQAPRGQPPQTIATIKGERKTVVLSDGSTVDLDSETVLVIPSGGAVRAIRLARGQAAFAVTHNPARPFAVYSGDRKISDIGTLFDVARLGDTVEVTVKQGEVAVSAAAAPAQGATDLVAGRQMTHRDGDASSTVRPIDPDAVFAWRTGRLIYNDAPLGVVASDLNRYFPTPIRVEGPSTAKLRFSGVLVLDSEDAVIGRLQAFFPVVVDRSNQGISIRKR